MSDDLTRRVTEILESARWLADADAARGIEYAARAIASLIAEEADKARKEGCAWAEAIERWFVEWEMMPDWSAADPWAELHRMICWEQKVALDPAVSEDARTLRASARREALEEAARWHETQIKRGEEAIGADPHVNYAAAIRSLAKEPTNGQ